MNFAAFQVWRQEQLRAHPGALDCAETNLYRALAALQPQPSASIPDHPVHRCDLARKWSSRYGFAEDDSSRALVCRGIRHALSLIFKEAAQDGSKLWMPGDVYPVYLELARAAGIQPALYRTLPAPQLPHSQIAAGVEYLLIANPWKPLGRFITEQECTALLEWLNASNRRYLLMDCVYDLGAPFHFTTRKLMETGRAILLHSVTKGWLWPKTFGVVLLRATPAQLESAFRGDSPSPQQLGLAEQCLGRDASLPDEVAAALERRKKRLMATLPTTIIKSLLIDSAAQAPGCYFFPSGISAGELMRQHGVVGIPASAFGAEWDGSILTSLAAGFAMSTSGGPA